MRAGDHFRCILLLLCKEKRVKMCCFVGRQVVKNVPVPVMLLPVRLFLDFTATKATPAEAAKIATKARRARQLAGKHTYCCTRYTTNREPAPSHKLHKNTYRCYAVHKPCGYLCCPVFHIYSAPQQTVIADGLQHAAQERAQKTVEQHICSTLRPR